MTTNNASQALQEQSSSSLASREIAPANALVSDCSVPVPRELATFEPQPLWSSRQIEGSKMELMQMAGRSPGTAYLIWFFWGLAGMHRLYLDRFASGIGMLVTLWLSAATMIIIIGFFGLFAVFVWWIIDAFLLAGWVKARNDRVACLVADVSSKTY